MIPALLLAAALAQAAPDPCGRVSPAAPDRPTAAAYLAIGDEERAAGREESAVAAYRAALARDPASAPARAALAELCRARRRDQEFDRGLALMRAGNCPAALPLLEAAHAQGDRAAALLEGICLYRAGEDQRAGAALRDAEQDPGSRSSAQLFLGLLALRGGRPGEAAPLLEAASGDPLLDPIASGLSRDARRQGRLVVSALAEGGWDSNVDLTPGTSFTPSGAGDALMGGAAVVTAAPWGERGPYARASGAWRHLPRHAGLDLAGVGGAAGVQLGGSRRLLLVEGGVDGLWLGGDPYLTAPRLGLEGRLDLGPSVGAAASAAVRRELFAGDASEYSGTRLSGKLALTTGLGAVLVTAGWEAEVDRARTSALSYREHGPVLVASAPLGSRARLALEAGWAWRSYDAVDASYEVRRSDTALDVGARLEVELSARWTAQLAVAARRAHSSVPEFRYARVVPTAALSWTMGVP